jgi:hypothetical protein
MNAAVKLDCTGGPFFKNYTLITPGGNTAIKGCKRPIFHAKGHKMVLIKNKATGVLNWCAVPDVTTRLMGREISTAHSLEVDSTLYTCASGGRGGTRRRSKGGRKTRRSRN